jgi:Ala-tRNA(Pro) deacylase
LRSALGIEPGSVSPFAAINDKNHAVTIVLDEALMRHDTLNFHPLINSRTTRIKREDFIHFLAATGHQPLIVAASAPS